MSILPKIDNTWTLFLDRDGVINELLRNDYVADWDKQWKYKNNADQAIVELSQLFKYIFVLTNQQGVGKGITTHEQIQMIHKNLTEDIKSKGGKIDAVYYSPYLESIKHPWRKPGIGMPEQAAKDFPEVDFTKSIMVGDFKTDMQMARQLKIIAVYVGEDENVDWDFRFNDLLSFKNAIVNQK